MRIDAQKGPQRHEKKVAIGTVGRSKVRSRSA